MKGHFYTQLEQLKQKYEASLVAAKHKRDGISYAETLEKLAKIKQGKNPDLVKPLPNLDKRQNWLPTK